MEEVLLDVFQCYQPKGKKNPNMQSLLPTLRRVVGGGCCSSSQKGTPPRSELNALLQIEASDPLWPIEIGTIIKGHVRGHARAHNHERVARQFCNVREPDGARLPPPQNRILARPVADFGEVEKVVDFVHPAFGGDLLLRPGRTEDVELLIVHRLVLARRVVAIVGHQNGPYPQFQVIGRAVLIRGARIQDQRQLRQTTLHEASVLVQCVHHLQGGLFHHHGSLSGGVVDDRLTVRRQHVEDQRLHGQRHVLLADRGDRAEVGLAEEVLDALQHPPIGVRQLVLAQLLPQVLIVPDGVEGVPELVAVFDHDEGGLPAHVHVQFGRSHHLGGGAQLHRQRRKQLFQRQRAPHHLQQVPQRDHLVLDQLHAVPDRVVDDMANAGDPKLLVQVQAEVLVEFALHPGHGGQNVGPRIGGDCPYFGLQAKVLDHGQYQLRGGPFGVRQRKVHEFQDRVFQFELGRDPVHRHDKVILHGPVVHRQTNLEVGFRD
mmetsp:Transcript_6984/g.9781  ORF Transcript_6984/g.9781 Transcript_6984/m.9781 type:complete len:488 (-) Transcript_6984:769-2232(-)